MDTSAYLEPTSDLIALMTLEHQTRVTNLMTRLSWETRIAIKEGNLKEAAARLDFISSELVSYMLFTGEAHMRETMAGVSTFTKTFPERGPRDKQGRSLRDFDLKTRLFRYPLSYMIYDPSFDALPAVAKDQVYRKLFDALTAKDTLDNRAIIEILRDTKPDLPDYWRGA
jgi:hypothetical protein